MPIKSQIFTTTSDWPVPASVSGVMAMWMGGGAGGANNFDGSGVEGGGGGELTIRRLISVTPGGTLSVVIGAGGVAGTISVAPGKGGTSTVGGYGMLGGLASTDSINHANGGGPNGGPSFLTGGATVHLDNGTLESPVSIGGCGGGIGGGNGSTNGIRIGVGGTFGEVIGEFQSLPGAAVPGCHGGGGGGAPSVLGSGGTGGSANDVNNGAGGTASAPGTGGGGACGKGTCTPLRGNLSGGAGFDGWAAIWWTEP